MTIAFSANNNGLSGQLKVAGSPVMSFGADTSGQLDGLRNYLINGGCQVAQRGNIAAVSNSFVYGGADRISVGISSSVSSSGTIQQYSGVATTTSYAQGVNVSVNGGWNVSFNQRIEAVNTIPLNSKSITVSCIAFQNTGSAQNILFTLGKPTSTIDNFSAITILSSSGNFSIPSGTPTRISWTYTLGSTDASLGLYIQPTFGGTGVFSTKDFWIGDFQLEKGSIATPFEIRPYGLELMLCQRYYQALTYYWVMYVLGSNSFTTQVNLPVTMRVAPSIVNNNSNTTNITGAALGATTRTLAPTGLATTTSYIIYTGTALLSAEL